MSVPSFNKDSGSNREEPSEEERGPSSDKELNEWLHNEQKELIIRRKQILPHLPWVFGVFSFICFMVVFTGYSLDRYYIENITVLAEAFLWLTFLSILVYVFGDSIINAVIGKISN